MTPNHTPASDGYPGMIRFKLSNGKSIHCLADPKHHADKVAKMIKGRE